jgi:hypothetical protein
MDLKGLFFRDDNSDEAPPETTSPDLPRDKPHSGAAGVPVDLDTDIWTALIAEPYGVGWGGNSLVDECV